MMLEMTRKFAPVDLEDVVNELGFSLELLQMVLDYFSEHTDSKHTDYDKELFHLNAERYSILTGQIFGELSDLRERTRITNEAYPDKKDELLKCVKTIADNL